MAPASVLPVALVAVVAAVSPLLRGGQLLPGLFPVLGDNGLGFLLLQLPVGHFIQVVAFFRQRVVGYKGKREACVPEKCIDGQELIMKTTAGSKFPAAPPNTLAPSAHDEATPFHVPEIATVLGTELSTNCRFPSSPVIQTKIAELKFSSGQTAQRLRNWRSLGDD